MRQGCEYIVGLKTRNPVFRQSLLESEEPFNKIVRKLDECSAKYGGCGWTDSRLGHACPDFTRCNNRFNGICDKAQSVSPPYAFAW